MEALVDGMAGNDHAASQRTATPDGRSMPQRRLAERKATLRKDLVAARVSMSVSDRQAAERALRDTLLGLPETGMAGTIAAYLSAGTEPGPAALGFGLWKPGRSVTLPGKTADRGPN